SGADGSTLAINFGAGGGTDQIIIVGEAGGQSLTETISTGGTSDSGAIVSSGDSATQSLRFTGTEKITDFTPASQTTFVASRKSDLIQFTNGDDVDGQHTGLISISTIKLSKSNGKKKKNANAAYKTTATFVPITFANKAALSVAGGDGDDFISLNMPNQP